MKKSYILLHPKALKKLYKGYGYYSYLPIADQGRLHTVSPRYKKK